MRLYARPLGSLTAWANWCSMKSGRKPSTLPVIPSEFVVYNPMGILITYLQADQALVTEQPR